MNEWRMKASNPYVSQRPIAEYVQFVCNDTLPWLISFSLGFARKANLS